MNILPAIDDQAQSPKRGTDRSKDTLTISSDTATIYLLLIVPVVFFPRFHLLCRLLSLLDDETENRLLSAATRNRLFIVINLLYNVFLFNYLTVYILLIILKAFIFRMLVRDKILQVIQSSGVETDEKDLSAQKP